MVDKLEHIDLLLGESLECMVEAASELKSFDEGDPDKKIRRIGRAIVELWEVRDAIYRTRPDLKRDFVKEQQEDKQRFDELNDLFHRAISSEQNKDKESAVVLFKELLEKSKAGYFTLLAEAGLYRLSQNI